MHTVELAEPYDPNRLGSLGDARLMLVRQVRFPHTYERNERMRGADHDRLLTWDSDHAMACCKLHTGRGPGAIGPWARNAAADALLAFCTNVVKADPAVNWTGCRVLGTVNRSNGHTVWSIQVFAKNPESDTQVYSDDLAPNVKPQVAILGHDGTIIYYQPHRRETA